MAKKKARSSPRTAASADGQVAQVAARIGGTTVAMIALIMIFGGEYKWIAAPVAAAMMLLGIFLGYFATKR